MFLKLIAKYLLTKKMLWNWILGVFFSFSLFLYTRQINTKRDYLAENPGKALFLLVVDDNWSSWISEDDENNWVLALMIQWWYKEEVPLLWLYWRWGRVPDPWSLYCFSLSGFSIPSPKPPWSLTGALNSGEKNTHLALNLTNLTNYLIILARLALSLVRPGRGGVK